MKKLKKVLSLCLVTFLCLGTSLTANAKGITEKTGTLAITSPEFPDAYIITKTYNSINNINSAVNENRLGKVAATVFVEEKYELINNELIVTDSKLLSKDEVMAIGVNNFKPLKNKNSISPSAATSARGTLTLTFDGSYQYVGNGVRANVTGNAKWSGFDFLYNSKNNPAIGSDFIGVAWAGGYTAPSSSCTATWNLGGSQSVYSSESVPNAGRVWEFEEFRDVAGKYMIYVDDVDVNMTLSKASLTGGGNTAEAVLKYIHTYQTVKGSISISASPSSVGAGFSLSGTDKQWSLVTTVTGIPQ